MVEQGTIATERMDIFFQASMRALTSIRFAAPQPNLAEQICLGSPIAEGCRLVRGAR